MGKKVKLNVLGFSFNQTQSGTYGLVLAEEGGLRRLMIVVGAPEAQSIAFQLQNVAPPRPLTHDLFKPILDSFFISLEEILINEFVGGVFHSKLILKQADHVIEIDSRTSDAVAIALRLGAPIYTTEEIMKDMAVVVDESALDERSDLNDDIKDKPYDFSLLDADELQIMLKEAIQDEDYELASILRDEIQRKKNPQ